MTTKSRSSCLSLLSSGIISVPGLGRVGFSSLSVWVVVLTSILLQGRVSGADSEHGSELEEGLDEIETVLGLW